MTDYDAIRRRIDGPARPSSITPPPLAEHYDQELRGASAARLEALAEAVEPRRDRAWGSLSEEERWSVRARNEQARRARLAERDAAERAEAEQRAGQAAAAAAAQRAELVARLRAGGVSAAAAEAQADRLLADQAAAAGDALVEAKRRQLAGF